MTSAGRILVIDDDEVVGMLVSAAAQAMGLHCQVAKDPTTYLDLLTPETTLILLDLVMPGMDGIEVLRILGEQNCKARIVLMSGMNKRVIETAKKLARTLGLTVAGDLQKPFGLPELKVALSSVSAAEMPEDIREGPLITFPDEQLKRAFDREEFANYYQPQINLQSGRVTGVEALSRWLHPEWGVILPNLFIARTESLGLMDRLCWITAEWALTEAKQFAGQDGSLLRLSLNASVSTLRDLRFPDSMKDVARKHDYPLDKIVIEITETGLINELAQTLDVLTRLRMKQIHLSIDDFGTGYAMMQQLQNIPATELKIDRSLVQNMYSNESDCMLVEKIIEMGHGLDMEVVAEGVTTREQQDLLRRMGCDAAQGFLFSRPLPAANLVEWLAAYRGGHGG